MNSSFQARNISNCIALHGTGRATGIKSHFPSSPSSSRRLTRVFFQVTDHVYIRGTTSCADETKTFILGKNEDILEYSAVIQDILEYTYALASDKVTTGATLVQNRKHRRSPPRLFAKACCHQQFDLRRQVSTDVSHTANATRPCSQPDSRTDVLDPRARFRKADGRARAATPWHAAEFECFRDASVPRRSRNARQRTPAQNKARPKEGGT